MRWPRFSRGHLIYITQLISRCSTPRRPTVWSSSPSRQAPARRPDSRHVRRDGPLTVLSSLRGAAADQGADCRRRGGYVYTGGTVRRQPRHGAARNPPPALISPGLYAKSVNVLQRLSGGCATVEINYHVDLRGVTDPVELYSRSAREKLRQARSPRLPFRTA